jgi:hypothetical protein
VSGVRIPAPLPKWIRSERAPSVARKSPPIFFNTNFIVFRISSEYNWNSIHGVDNYANALSADEVVLMDCKKQVNLKRCNCSYPCSRKGLCCECVAYHREAGELPACYFDVKNERTYDRSVEAYLKMRDEH